MALGYCSRCGELVKIRAGARHRPPFRSRVWWPLPHQGPDGEDCRGENDPAGDVAFKAPGRA